MPILHEQIADNQLTNFIVYSQKYGGSDTGLIPVCPSLAPELQSFVREGGFCTVVDQPIPLDRLTLRNIDPIHVTGTCPRAFQRLHKHHLNALRTRQCKDTDAVCPQTTPRRLEWKRWCLGTVWLHSSALTARHHLLTQT